MSKMKDILHVQEILLYETDFRGAIQYVNEIIGEQARDINNDLLKAGISSQDIHNASKLLMKHEEHGAIGKELLDHIVWQSQADIDTE